MLKKLLLSTILVLMAAYTGQAQADQEEPLKICSPTECYTIIQELGQGAFGKVWSVENSKGDRFALKSYKPHDEELGFFWGLYADAKREYELGQSFDHPHIIKTVEFFQDEPDSDKPTTYLVLELVEGKTVGRTPKKALMEGTAFTLDLQLIDALKYALSREYIYLDLHSNNIMLAESFDTKIIDLASFVSFDEFFDYFKQKEQLGQKGLVSTQQSLRNQKIDQFFQRYPDVYQKLQGDLKALAKEGDIKVLVKDKSIDNNHFAQEVLMPLLSRYMDNITELCIDIITKSDLDREKKIQTYASMKILAWNYLEDADEMKSIPINFYLEQLVKVLNP